MGRNRIRPHPHQQQRTTEAERVRDGGAMAIFRSGLPALHEIEPHEQPERGDGGQDVVMKLGAHDAEQRKREDQPEQREIEHAARALAGDARGARRRT